MELACGHLHGTGPCDLVEGLQQDEIDGRYIHRTNQYHENYSLDAACDRCHVGATLHGGGPCICACRSSFPSVWSSLVAMGITHNPQRSLPGIPMSPPRPRVAKESSSPRVDSRGAAKWSRIPPRWN